MNKVFTLQVYAAGMQSLIQLLFACKSMQRFFIHNVELQVGAEGEFPTDITHQLLHVLRMSSGDLVVLLDNTGKEYESEVRIEGKNAWYLVQNERANEYEPAIHVTLYQSLLKQQEKFELVLQKGTELGVSRFVPLVTERCQVQELRKQDRLERIVREAAEQCERGRLPELTKETSISEVFEAIQTSAPKEATSHTDTYLFFYEGLRDMTLSLPELSENVHVIIGPEGGFSESEASQLEEICHTYTNCHLVSLGKRVLRSETASIAALSHVLL